MAVKEMATRSKDAGWALLAAGWLEVKMWELR